MSKIETRVIQVTNVAPTTTKEQIKTLFQFIGRIREVKVFPPEGVDQPVAAKVCYIEFDDPTSTGVAMHLTNTVFIDRALIVVPVMDGKIPDDKVAMQLTPQTVARMSPGQPAWPANVVSQLSGAGSGQAISTYDPRLNALGLPQYPPLPANLDAAKVEEIRRTVYIGNLDPKTAPENLLSFFSQAGEVKYVRMAGDSEARGAYLELTDQRSVATCLGYNGVNYGGRTITVSHSKMSIAKPLSKSQEATRREVEEAMKKVKEAQSLISAAAGEKSRSRSRSRKRSRSRGYSRSRSRSRKRSRSRSRGGVRRRRSRSRSRRRSRSPRRVRRSRTRSPPRRRRSRSRRRRSRSPSRNRRRSRSRSRRRSRTPPRAYSSRRSRSRSRQKSPIRGSRRSRSRSRGRRRDSKDRKAKSGEKKKETKKSVSHSPSPPTLKRIQPVSEGSGDEGPPAKLDSSEAVADKKAAKKRDRTKSPPPRRRKSPSRSPVRSRKRSPSRSPVRARRRSISPRKRRSKSRSPRRSRSPAKKKKVRSPRRSRSGSRHRSKKDKKKERSRSRDRKDKDKKKKSSKDKRGGGEDKEKDKGPTGKVLRDYDEEEKGFNSTSEQEEEMRSQAGDEEARSPGGDQQMVDMDTSD